MVRVRSFSGGVGKFALRRFCIVSADSPGRGGRPASARVPLRKYVRRKSMYCPKCGKELADDAVLCDNCGKPFNGHRQSKSAAGGWQNGTRAAVPYNTMCIIGAVVSGISLLVPVCGIGGFILSRMGKKQIEETGERGKDLAVAGMIVGGITTGITVISIILLLATLAWGALATLGFWFL